MSTTGGIDSNSSLNSAVLTPAVVRMPRYQLAAVILVDLQFSTAAKSFTVARRVLCSAIALIDGAATRRQKNNRAPKTQCGAQSSGCARFRSPAERGNFNIRIVDVPHMLQRHADRWRQYLMPERAQNR